MLRKITSYFTPAERALWFYSALAIILSFFLFDRSNFFTLAASLVGITALIFSAKGNPIGQALMIIFGLMYGIISFSYSYYGEVITYVGMTGPMSAVALVSWLRHPFRENHAQVAVNRVSGKEAVFMLLLTGAVTVVFHFILKYLGTANILPGTISVATTFSAVYLTFRRSPYFALVYALNDIVLIVLWALAAVENVSYLSVVICFLAFFAGDLYGFLSWRKMQKAQSQADNI